MKRSPAVGIHTWHHRHARTWGAVCVSLVLAGVADRPGFGQDVSVTGGAVQSNNTPASYTSLTVSGTSAGGSPSTYTANALLTLSNDLTVMNAGVLNASADILVNGTAEVHGGGVVNLNAGTLTAVGPLRFRGTGSVNRSGGHYAATSLHLEDGATLTYGTGDTISSGASMYTGGTLTLAEDLSVTGNIVVGGAGSTIDLAGYDLTANDVMLQEGGTLSRTFGAITAGTTTISNSTLDLRAGDSVAFLVDVRDGAILSASAGTTLSRVTVSGLNGSGDRSTFNVDGDTTLSVSATALTGGGLIKLNAGTLAAGTALLFGGPGSVQQNGGHFSAPLVSLVDGATLTYGPGDTISSELKVLYGSALTLARDLSVTGTVEVYGAGSTINLAGYDLTAGDSLQLTDGGMISRTTESISANYFLVDNSTLALRTGDTFNPSYTSTVRNGGTVSAAAGTSLGSLEVYDTDISGNLATFDVDGDTTIADSALASYGGVINLNSGTLSAGSFLYFTGAGSVNQNGGNYSAPLLYLLDGATLTYGSGDTISSGASIFPGGTLTLAKDLSVTDVVLVLGAGSTINLAGHDLSAGKYLQLADGGTISRTTEGISAAYFDVIDSTLALHAGDTFDPTYASTVRSGATVTAAAGTSLGSVEVFGTNGFGNRSTFDVDGDTTLAGYAFADLHGVINLNSGTLTAASYLSLWGPGSLNQRGGNYSTPFVALGDGATLTYGTGDTISSGASMYTGGTLTLAEDLSVTGSVGVFGGGSTIDLGGHDFSADSLYLTDGGAISRTTGALTLGYFNVDNSTLALRTGDSSDPGVMSYIVNGGTVSAAAGTSLGSLSITGTNGSGDRSTFIVNGDTTLAGYAGIGSHAFVDLGGVIELNSGTLTVDDLHVYGAGSVNQSGGNYIVASLSLIGGGTLTYGLGDDIGSLTIDGAGSVLEEFAPLSLTSLSVSNNGLLRLSSFTGMGAVSNWGLRLSGNTVGYLQSLIAGSLLTSGSLLSVVYDAGSGSTYVTGVAAVPEIDPAGMGSVLGLVTGALGLLERRRLKAA